MAEESVIQGEDDVRKNRNLPLLHVQSIRLFHVSLEYSGGKEHLLLWSNYRSVASGERTLLCSLHSDM